jgi:hypothetical protein
MKKRAIGDGCSFLFYDFFVGLAVYTNFSSVIFFIKNKTETTFMEKYTPCKRTKL